MNLKDVQIVITRETKVPAQSGFGLPLVLCTTKTHPYTEYYEVSELPADVFPASSDVYKIVARMLGQTPRPEKVAVFGFEYDKALRRTVTGEALTSTDHQVYAFSHQQVDKVTAVRLNTSVITTGFTFDKSTQKLTFEAQNGGTDVVDVDYEWLEGDLPTVLVDKLNNLVEKNGDFYFLYCDRTTKEEIQTLSEWINTQKRLYFADTTDKTLAAQLNSDRTVLMVHHDTDERVAAGWVGRCAPLEPGSFTWKYKTVNGVSEADIGATELIQLHHDGGNSYIQKMGVLQSSEGLTTSGEYIDIMQSQDFVEARISENVHMLLFNSDKVPYDDSGIALIGGQIREVMQLATGQGIIAKDENDDGIWNIYLPRRADIPAAQRATRVLPDIEFDFELAGAVHGVKIRGIIRV